MYTMNRIFRCIADHACIDVQRALGIYDRVQIPDGFSLRNSPVIFRHFPEKKTIMYVDFRPIFYEFTTYTNVEMLDGDIMISCDVNRVYQDEHDNYVYLCEHWSEPFYFAGSPEVM
jgi:hypothetical protein